MPALFRSTPICWRSSPRPVADASIDSRDDRSWPHLEGARGRGRLEAVEVAYACEHANVPGGELFYEGTAYSPAGACQEHGFA